MKRIRERGREGEKRIEGGRKGFSDHITRTFATNLRQKFNLRNLFLSKRWVLPSRSIIDRHLGPWRTAVGNVTTASMLPSNDKLKRKAFWSILTHFRFKMNAMSFKFWAMFWEVARLLTFYNAKNSMFHKPKLKCWNTLWNYVKYVKILRYPAPSSERINYSLKAWLIQSKRKTVALNHQAPI